MCVRPLYSLGRGLAKSPLLLVVTTPKKQQEDGVGPVQWMGGASWRCWRCWGVHTVTVEYILRGTTGNNDAFVLFCCGVSHASLFV